MIDPNLLKGISGAEARLRQIEYGPNIISKQHDASWLGIAYAVVKQPIFLLLIIAEVIYLLLGNIDDAIILMGFITISTGITVFQQYRSEKALESLRELATPQALVIRDGITTHIPAQELVPGDFLMLKEGGRILADAKIIDAHDLMVDESLLTGESIPIDKVITQTVYSGTMVVRGGGMAEVCATGLKTQLGQIGTSLIEVKPTESHLQIEIRLLIKYFAILGLFIAIVSIFLYGILQNRWFDGVLIGISIAMALLPEEFSVVLTIFLALGVWRISRYQVLTRHAPVIETLGSISTLCVDKTGTLTINSMELVTVALPSQVIDINTQKGGLHLIEAQNIITVAMMASEITPFDPMEKAIHRAYRLHCSQQLVGSNAQLVYEYGLRSTLPVITHIWDLGVNYSNYHVTAKGAPEAIMKLCKLSREEINKIEKQISESAIKGSRMLGVAQCHYEKKYQEWPDDVSDFNFKWLGLIGLSDPIRENVPKAIKLCREAGIRVAMITGDHLLTAKQIAKQAGIDARNILTGAEIESIDDQTLKSKVKNTTVFVRITPKQKLRIIQAMQSNSEIVAMTGDGINDAPALKAANVGISMGKRGTDVAREASSLVLLNDDFASLIKAIQQGRRIFDNLQKAINYIIAVHIPIAGAVLLPLIFGNPPILTPIHILFLEIIIDPACAIIYEMEHDELDVMKRPPRNPNIKWFDAPNLSMPILQGLGILILVTGCYLYFLNTTSDAELANTIAFTLLAFSNLILILVNRSSKKSILRILKIPNPSQKWILLWAITSFILLFSIPHLREKWALSAINFQIATFLFFLILIGLIWCELVKKYIGKLNHSFFKNQINLFL